MDLSAVLEAFDLNGEPEELPGGTRPAYRVGGWVLKHIHETSLESNHSLDLVQWIAEFSESLPQQGFRIPKARRTRDGCWLTPDGWTAWSFLEGSAATVADVADCIPAVLALHHTLALVPIHPLMNDNRTAWGKADRWCFGGRPAYVHPQVRSYVDTLYTLREPVTGLTAQLVHGDLNLGNILVAPGQPPAFIDLSPYWQPVEFALGMFGNWAGPRQGNSSVLPLFESITHFRQMLIRASIRMLLIMSELNGLDEWGTCEEKRAAEIVIEYVSNQ